MQVGVLLYLDVKCTLGEGHSARILEKPENGIENSFINKVNLHTQLFISAKESCLLVLLVENHPGQQQPGFFLGVAAGYLPQHREEAGYSLLSSQIGCEVNLYSQGHCPKDIWHVWLRRGFKSFMRANNSQRPKNGQCSKNFFNSQRRQREVMFKNLNYKHK